MEIQGIFINAKNIAYVDWERKDSYGYNWKTNITFYIYFIGKDKPLTFTFFNEEEIEETMKKLKEVLL